MIRIELSQDVKGYIEEKHYSDIKEKYIKHIENIPCPPKLKQYLFHNGNINENHLRKIILGDKDELLKIIKEIGEIDSKCFGTQIYNRFSNRKWATELLEKINARVCPYCNRQYTFTLKRKDKVRAQFDHYFPQSKYAYLQVSLYNLIPCCSLCNQKKSNYNPIDNQDNPIDNQGNFNESKALFYPYDSGFGHDITFGTSSKENDINYWLGIGDNFKVDLKVRKDMDPLRKEVMDKRLEIVNTKLKLDILYKEHKDYVRDIIIKLNVYTDEQIEGLLNDFPHLFSSKEEIVNNIFMNYLNPEDWIQRPLAKLTHDIYYEMKP